jgi:DNA-binding NarL/FixJ family response regulator
MASQNGMDGPDSHSRKVRLLVVEDHEVVVLGLQSAFCDIPRFDLRFAASRAEAIKCLEQPVDLILLDLYLPDVPVLDPLSCLKGLRQSNKDTPVLVFSGSQSSALIRASLEAGASGFIPKSTSIPVLVSAMDLVLNGGTYLPPHLLTMLDGKSLSPASEPTLPQMELRLTPRQQSVLALLLEGRSNKEIAGTLGLSVGTIKNYVSDLLKSTNAKTRGRILAMLSTPTVQSEEAH